MENCEYFLTLFSELIIGSLLISSQRLWAREENETILFSLHPILPGLYMLPAFHMLHFECIYAYCIYFNLPGWMHIGLLFFVNIDLNFSQIYICIWLLLLRFSVQAVLNIVEIPSESSRDMMWDYGVLFPSPSNINIMLILYSTNSWDILTRSYLWFSFDIWCTNKYTLNIKQVHLFLIANAQKCHSYCG